MWRSFGLLACLSLEWSAAHPGCHPGGFPDADKTASTFCPAEQFDGTGSFIQFGSCCTDSDEEDLAEDFAEAMAAAPGVEGLSLECAELHKQVVCGPCHSFAGHLYEAGDGLTMKRAFCEAYTDACSGEISFDSDYCDDQVGSASGPDSYWSYPYLQDEAFAEGFAEVFPGASLPNRAFSMQQTPDGSMYFIAGHTGEIKKVMASDLGSSSDVMTLTSDDNDFFTNYGSQTDEGLNHFVFSPNFAVNNFFYVSFNVEKPGESNTRCRLSKFTYNPSSGTAGSEEVLLETALKISPYHPGGWVGFKPDSYDNPGASSHDIYWSTGDGSQQEDKENLAQDLTNLLGSMIRIQVPSAAGSSGFDYPSSGNYGGGADPAVCAIGFRNPWRCSFSPDGDLYCGDVGQYKIEEISKVECGKNYGWSLFEGSRCQSSAEGLNGLPICEDDSTDSSFRDDYTFPFYEYCHSSYWSYTSGSIPDDEAVYTNGDDPCGDRDLIGSAVIGGYWYKGVIFSDLLGGAYIFADYTNQNIYYIKNGNLGTIISDGSIQVVSFSEDINGELMVLDKSGSIFHLRCGDLCPPPTICPEGGLTFDGEIELAAGESCNLEGSTFTFPASAIGSVPSGYSVSAVSDGVNSAVGVEGGQVSIFLIPDEGTTLTVSLTGGGEDTDCNTVTVLPACEASTPVTPAPIPETTTPAPTPDQVASTCPGGIDGINAGDVVCCALSCGECAGSGCSSRPGGASACCGGGVKASDVYCDESGSAPCIIGSRPAGSTPAPTPETTEPTPEPTPAPTPDQVAETCPGGIEGINANDAVCCPLSCGECAGAGCSSRPGGASACCGGGVKASDVYCDESGSAPCIIGSRPGGGETCPGDSLNANDAVCCPASCGECAGTGCSSRPGGASACCGGAVKASDVYCDESGSAPCILGSRR